MYIYICSYPCSCSSYSYVPMVHARFYGLGCFTFCVNFSRRNRNY